MSDKLLKYISLICGVITFGMGALYLTSWFFGDFSTHGISYAGSIAFILTGLSLLFLQRWVGFLLCLLCLFRFVQILVFSNSFEGEYFVFLSPSHPINIFGFALLGLFFVMWNDKKPSQNLLLFGFFAGFCCIAIALLGIVIEDIHIRSPLVTLLIASIGFIAEVYRLKRLHQISLYQWSPFVSSVMTLGICLPLAYIIQSHQLVLKNVIHMTFPYTYVIGVLFSLFIAFFVYYFNLSKLQMKQLQETQKKLKDTKDAELSALKASEVGTWRWDVLNDKIYIDEVISNLYNITPKNFNGRFAGILKFAHPHDRDAFASRIEHILKKNDPFDMDFRFVLPDGSIRFLRIKGNYLNDTTLTGIIVDITEIKNTKLLLQLSEGVAKILGRAPTLAVAASELLDLVHRKFGWEILAIWKQREPTSTFDCLALESKSPMEDSLDTEPFSKLLLETGEPIAIENLSTSPLFKRSTIAAREGMQGALVFPIIENNKTTGVIELFKKAPFPEKIDTKTSNLLKAVGMNIGEFIQKKKSELEKEELAEKYRLFVESTEDWIWEMDQTGRFTFSNPGVKNILDYSPSEVIGKVIFNFLPEEDRLTAQNEFNTLIRLGQGWTHLLRVWKDKQGNHKTIESAALPIYNEQNIFIGFRGISRDVTEQAKIDKTKNEFISMVGHEIKTPLTSIQGALGLLSIQPNFSPKIKELVDLAYRNSNQLVHLIQDIIDIEKISLGKFDYHFEEVVLIKLIQEAIHTVSLISKREKVHLVLLGMIDTLKVHVDPSRITQVLLNLISNAINYSPPEGKITITMEKTDGIVRVSIKDEGPGIPEEFHSKIFGRFEQAYSSISRAQKGTGLGLNISKTIIEKMGGTIGFTSKPQEGTTFYFELPVVNV